MKHRLIPYLVASCLVIVGCANQEVPAATNVVAPLTSQPETPISTLDPCARENLEGSVKQVNDLMREFKDAFELASNVAKEHVPPIISDMQRIRRAAEDQKVPACLVQLKTHQLAHMNMVINTMLGFVSGADAAALSDGMGKSQQEYDLYTAELARLLGVQPTATATP